MDTLTHLLNIFGGLGWPWEEGMLAGGWVAGWADGGALETTLGSPHFLPDL